MDVIIYHNPDCGTSRNTLAMIRNAGIEPHVIEYLKTPPTRLLLRQLIDRMGVAVREVVLRRAPIGQRWKRAHDVGQERAPLGRAFENLAGSADQRHLPRHARLQL